MTHLYLGFVPPTKPGYSSSLVSIDADDLYVFPASDYFQLSVEERGCAAASSSFGPCLHLVATKLARFTLVACGALRRSSIDN